MKNILNIGILSLLCMTLIACGSKLTQAHFEKVTDGMNLKEVKALIGDPQQAETATIPLLGNQITKYTYRTDKAEATVVFKDEKVISKAGSFR
ncbi:MAG: hypothetical protein ACOY3I_02640 [Verrucomicrobiota bacterium]